MKKESLKQLFKNNWPIFLILTVLVFTTYGNSLNNAFVSDDIAEIRDNPNMGNFSYVFTHPYGFIRLILYYFVYQIAGLSPIGFRLINFFFHIGSVLLIYILIKLLYSSKRIAFFSSAIFAVHPAISESIIWISGGSYPQYTFFFLISLIIYIVSKENWKYYLLSLIFFLFSFMSHPVMPLPLFLVFGLYEICFGDIKKNWAKSIPYLMFSIAYTFINLSVIPIRTSVLQTVHYQEKGVDNLFIIVPIAVSSYFELIFWPKILTLYHSELAFQTFQFIINCFVTIAYFAFLIFAFIKNKKLFFPLFLFILSLSPTLTPFRFNWIVAERYIYLGLLGIIVPVIYLFEKNIHRFKIKNLDVYILGIIIILLLTRTIIRTTDWKSEDTLWIATGITSPSSPNNHNNLGDVYGRQGDKLRAVQEFQTAIDLKPNYADAYHNMANAYRELGQMDKALQDYNKAATLNPNLWQSYQNIAAIYFGEKKYDLALKSIQKAIQINPKNINLYLNMGVVYLTSGNREKAKETFQNILNADPNNQIAKQGIIEASK